MAVRPIDIQNSIVRSPDAQKMLDNQVEKARGDGVNNPDIIEEEIHEENTSVQTSESSEESKAIKEDEKGSSFLAQQQKKKKDEREKKEKKELKDGIRGNFIDIKVCY